MRSTPRPLVYFAILILTVGFSVLTDVSDMAPRHDQTRVRCTWPAGVTSGTPWYVEEVGGAEAEKPEKQTSIRCASIRHI